MKRTLALASSLMMLLGVIGFAQAAPTEIEYWSVFTGADGATMQAMVDSFNASQDEIKVNHTPMTADDLYQKLPLAVQSGSGIPHVVIVHIERIPMFVKQDLIWPLDTLLENGINQEDYIPSAWARTDIDGEHYGIPLDVHSYITYYNKDVFDKYDLNEFVEDGYLTFDEIRALGDKAHEQGFEGPIMGLDWFRAQMLSYYAQLNGNLTDDGVNPSFNNEDMATVYQTLKDLHDDGYTTKKGDDPLQMFYSGDLPVWPEGIWMKAAVVDAGINFGMLPAISFTPEKTKSWTSSHNFVQFADDERTEEEDIAVAKFVKYIGEEQSFVWARDGGQVPAHVSINAVPEFHDLAQSFLADPERGDELWIYYYLYWGLFDTAFSRNGWEPVFGTMTIEEALDAAEQEVADAIAAL